MKKQILNTFSLCCILTLATSPLQASYKSLAGLAGAWALTHAASGFIAWGSSLLNRAITRSSNYHRNIINGIKNSAPPLNANQAANSAYNIMESEKDLNRVKGDRLLLGVLNFSLLAALTFPETAFLGAYRSHLEAESNRLLDKMKLFALSINAGPYQFSLSAKNTTRKPFALFFAEVICHQMTIWQYIGMPCAFGALRVWGAAEGTEGLWLAGHFAWGAGVPAAANLVWHSALGLNA